MRRSKKLSSDLRPPVSETEDFWALKDINFEIKQGEVVGIIGRNGAGKSTLLKILSRITEPTTGRITLKGRVASLLEVGTGFHPELTGRENIYLNGAILGMRRDEIKSKFDEIVAFAEIERFLDTPVKRYSSGMYVRLAFAVAAHLEPEILIVDEVLAVGDAQFQKKCLGKMQDVASGGRTVLFVSHNMGAVASLCDRGILLSKGTLVANDEIGVVINSYLADSSSRHESERQVVHQLDGNLSLKEFEVLPITLTSQCKMTVCFKLEARDHATTLDLGLQLYSPSNIRLAEFDLRHPTQPCAVTPGQETTVRIEVDRLPLVEGNYSLTLFYRCAQSTGHLEKVAELTVLPGPPMGLVTPVPPQYRGFFEIPYQFDFS